MRHFLAPRLGGVFGAPDTFTTSGSKELFGEECPVHFKCSEDGQRLFIMVDVPGPHGLFFELSPRDVALIKQTMGWVSAPGRYQPVYKNEGSVVIRREAIPYMVNRSTEVHPIVDDED